MADERPTELKNKTQKRRAQIFVMHANGITYKDISVAFGISPTRARQIDVSVELMIENKWESAIPRLKRRAIRAGLNLPDAIGGAGLPAAHRL